jgi:hypothetical protein
MPLCFRYARKTTSLFRVLVAASLAANANTPVIAQTQLPPSSRVADAPTLRIQLSTEQPTGVFFDSDTLQTQTALLFSLRVWNEAGVERPVVISWRIEDANGRTLWKKKTSTTVAQSTSLLRREAWEAPRRGAYRLRVDVLAKNVKSKNRNRKGAALANAPNDWARQESAYLDWPFAVIRATRASFRPRSFFALSTPTFLSDSQLDFYARSGARLLRSSWLPSDWLASSTAQNSAGRLNETEFSALDSQMQARLKRRLATWGVLPAASNASTPIQPSPSFENAYVSPSDIESAWQNAARQTMTWPRALPLLAARYNAIARWELFGDTTSQNATLLDISALDNRTRASLSLLAPLRLVGANSSTRNAASNGQWDATTISLPLDEEASLRFGSLQFDSSRTLRALLWAQKSAPRNASQPRPNFYVLQNEALPARSRRSDERQANEAAALMVRRYILSVVAKASGASLPGFAPGSAGLKTTAQGDWKNESREQREAGKRATSETLSGFARASAFAGMTHLLENSAPEKQLFSASPLLWGATFRVAETSDALPISQVAVLWMEKADRDDARLLLRLPSSRVLDMFGNPLAQAKNGLLRVPLSAQPVYVVSSGAPANVARAWREARLEGVEPLAAQILMPTKTPDAQLPTPKKGAASTQQVQQKRQVQSLRVRLQNVSIAPVGGVLRLKAPEGWVLSRDVQNFRLESGQSRIYRFPVLQSRLNNNRSYAVSVSAQMARERLSWKAKVPLATATNVARNQTVRIDGDLREWQNASWMAMHARPVARPIESASSTRKNAPPVFARLALRWDKTRLYIAAKVIEPNLQPRRVNDANYAFWNRHDALQLAFGLRDDQSAKPSREAFRDTDYGFLISPFGSTLNNAWPALEGRVLRLWNPTIAFDGASDTQRFGGVVSGSRCVVRRDVKAGTTNYEASFPLAEMPTLKPWVRAAADTPIRFSWIAHNDEGADLQWSQAGGVFGWWANPQTFLPASRMNLAAQTILGFTQADANVAGENVSRPNSSTRIAPPRTNTTPKPRPAKQPRRTPPLPKPKPAQPQIQPMKIEPMPVEPTQPRVLPPAPVRNEPLPQLPPSPPQ